MKYKYIYIPNKIVFVVEMTQEKHSFNFIVVPLKQNN